jgi:ADP-L-glycero-D-manno-heptose 6-epimerase
MILVTGANGFIGSVIVWELNQAGVKDIICVDTVSREQRPEPLSKRSYARFILKDQIWDFLNLPETKKNLTWIIHMGANSSTTETNWEHLYENNTMYTQRIFEWCTENNKNLIYASSAATYGAGENGYNDETDPNQLKALNLYGKSKLIFDQWALKQTKTPSHWYGLKFFNVYGPNEYHKESMSSVVFKAFHQIKESGELKLFKSYLPDYKDGEQMRDFVYVKDVTSWILELTNKRPKSGIYNMGYGRARTWVDLARSTFAAMGKVEKLEFIEMPENVKNQYQYFTEAKMTKWIGQKLSAPKWPIEEGVKDYVVNYLQKSDPVL